MPSFQITLSPKRRAATRFIGQVRRQLQRALAEEKATHGATQSGVARKLDVHRSVISRELRGQKDIGLGRVAEFAWALGLEPHLELKRAAQPGLKGFGNIRHASKIAPGSAGRHACQRRLIGKLRHYPEDATVDPRRDID
jgi:hypothetical protein